MDNSANALPAREVISWHTRLCWWKLFRARALHRASNLVNQNLIVLPILYNAGGEQCCSCYFDPSKSPNVMKLLKFLTLPTLAEACGRYSLTTYRGHRCPLLSVLPSIKAGCPARLLKFSANQFPGRFKSSMQILCFPLSKLLQVTSENKIKNILKNHFLHFKDSQSHCLWPRCLCN